MKFLIDNMLIKLARYFRNLGKDDFNIKYILLFHNYYKTQKKGFDTECMEEKDWENMI
jgi:hypothetical protein